MSKFNQMLSQAIMNTDVLSEWQLEQFVYKIMPKMHYNETCAKKMLQNKSFFAYKPLYKLFFFF